MGPSNMCFAMPHMVTRFKTEFQSNVPIDHGSLIVTQHCRQIEIGLFSDNILTNERKFQHFAPQVL